MRLKIIKGKSIGKEFTFRKGRVVVGRNQDNDLVVYDLNVSRHHFEILQDKEMYLLRDLGSRNGTKLNEKLTSDGRLEHGDRISVGAIEFEFISRVDGEKPLPQLTSEHTMSRNVNAPTSLTQRHVLEHIQTKALTREEIEKQSPILQLKAASNFGKEEAKKIPAPKSKKQLVLLGMSLLILIVALARSGYLFYQQKTRMIQDVIPLSAKALRQSVGFGRVDMRVSGVASFVFTSHGGRLILSYEAGGIERPDELEIFLNEQSLGFVPVSGAKWGKLTQMKLPRLLVSTGQENRLYFVHHPLIGEPVRWGVNQVKLTEEPIPSPSRERAIELMKFAQRSYEHKKVDPNNLSVAEENYRRAILLLEGYEPRPPEYEQAENGYRQVRDELTLILESGMFRAEKAQRYGKNDEAETILRELLLYLPREQDPRREEILTRLSSLGKTK